jgi:tRNA modification GTPase
MSMSFREDNETIAALATMQGKTALAIIRISGKKSFEIIKKCIFPEEKFVKASPKTINLYKFLNNQTKKIIDEITAIKYEFPKSYTGENMVEIICHGSIVVIEEILSILNKNGIRFAKKGEFTRRAYINGKMDLLKAESISQIIQCNGKWQYKNAMEMYSGASKKKIKEMKNEIIEILAEIEAQIEFPEEDDVKGKKKENSKKIEKLLVKIEKEIEKREKVKIIDSGFIIPLVGIPNAGKSSLFNLIIGFNRAIVHHEEGTTRDAISEDVIIKGEKIKFIDTAGLNKTKNMIEILGIKKTWEYIDQGNLVVLVTPANNDIKDEEERIIELVGKEKIVAIISKKDINDTEKKKKILKNLKIQFIEACLIDENERSNIIDFIGSHIEEALKLNEDEYGIICNKRHEEIFLRIKKKVTEIIKKRDNNFEEIISFELKEILNDLEEFIGETNNEEILDSIFSEFCIGK